MTTQDDPLPSPPPPPPPPSSPSPATAAPKSSASVAVLALSTALLVATVAFAKELSPNGVSGTLQATWVLSAVAVACGVLVLAWVSGSVGAERGTDRPVEDVVGVVQLATFLASVVLVVVLGFELPGSSAGTPVPVGSAAATTTTGAGVRGAPVISGVRPDQGRVGTRVVIRGSGLLGVTRVAFMGAYAAVASETATRVVVRVPPRARTGTISVTTSLGTGHSPGVFVVRS